MSIGFIVFMAILIFMGVIFLTPWGRNTFRGLRSVVVSVWGHLAVGLDQVLGQLQAFDWVSYLDRKEALIAMLSVIGLTGLFTAAKFTTGYKQEAWDKMREEQYLR